MPELLGCLSALDQSAESAVRVIAYFDALVDGHAGLDAFIRGAAVLAGCSAGLHDPGRGSRIRMDAQGRRLDFGHADPADGWPAVWMDSQLARVWLERDTAPAPTDSMILERLAAGSRVVLDHTRGRSPVRSAAGDPALAEVLIDDEARAGVRVSAARRLGLGDATTVCAVETMPLAVATSLPAPACGRRQPHYICITPRCRRALASSSALSVTPWTRPTAGIGCTSRQFCVAFIATEICPSFRGSSLLVGAGAQARPAVRVCEVGPVVIG